jgi:hypothetical protein
MSNVDQNGDQAPTVEAERVKKRNKVVGLSLGIFVIALGIISYFRIKGLAP